MAKSALDLIEEAGWHPEPRLWRDDAEECSILAAIPADAVEQIAKRDAEIARLRKALREIIDEVPDDSCRAPLMSRDPAGVAQGMGEIAEEALGE